MQPRFTVLCLLLTLSLPAQAIQGTATTTACAIEKSVQINLSSRDTKDRVEITAKGNPCIDGMHTVRILAGGERLIFTEEFPVKALIFDPLEVTLEDVANQMDSLLNNETTTGAWPPYTPKEKQLDALYHYNVTEQEYEALRKKDLPAFTLFVHYEVWLQVVYDPDTGKAVIIWEASL